MTRFTLNGRVVQADTSPNTTLLDFLRQDLALTGTKEGCAEGDCGACTVAMLDRQADGTPTWRAINSCLTLVPMVHGREVVTVEGLAEGDALHPSQRVVVDRLASQCGYCTPGVVMSLFEACYRTDLDSEAARDDQMCGNLCRCTGYRPIKDAAAEVAGCRPADRFATRLVEPWAPEAAAWTRGEEAWSAPDADGPLFDALDSGARIVCGATDLGLLVTQRGERFAHLVSVENLPGLKEMRQSADGGLHIGAAVCLADIEEFARASHPAISRMLRFFGSRQIKHRATLGGNLCNASPIGDMAPVLLALGASVVLRSRGGERTVPLDAFFLGYRHTALAPGEILAAVTVPPVPATVRTAAFKVSRRREMDISAVALGGAVDVREGVVAAIRLGFGGMAATPARAREVEAALVGQPWSEAAVEAAVPVLAASFTPLSDHRGSAWYRRTVAANLLRAFVEETAEDRFRELPQRPLSTVVEGRTGKGGAA